MSTFEEMQKRAAESLQGIQTSASGVYSGAQAKAQQLGAAAGSAAQWAHATALQRGTEAYNTANLALKAKVRAEYGEEVFDMMEALSACTDKLGGELEVKGAKYGVGMALPLLSLMHTDLPLPASKGEVTDLDFIQEIRYWLDYAAGAYGDASVKGDHVKSVQKAIKREKTEVKMADLPAGGVQCPGHYVAVDPVKKCVVLGVRGTTTLSDALTDAVGESVHFPELSGVEAHKAMLASAREVLKRTSTALAEAVQANPGFDLMVTGHSLGAGTAILCSLLMSVTPVVPTNPKLKCFAYAPPPVVGPHNHPKVQAVKICSFVNKNDAVPRASLSNVFHLGQECMAVDKLDLSFLDRLALIHKGAAVDAAENAKKKNVVDAAMAIRTKTMKESHPRFPKLYVPGDVYWFEWPKVAGEGHHKIHKTEATEFQSILLRGGVTALKDHLCSNYEAAIDGAKQGLLNRGCGAQCQLCTIL